MMRGCIYWKIHPPPTPPEIGLRHWRENRKSRRSIRRKFESKIKKEKRKRENEVKRVK
jgi:hypothetical protein